MKKVLFVFAFIMSIFIFNSNGQDKFVCIMGTIVYDSPEQIVSITRINRGDKVYVIETLDKFYKVNFNDIVGYVIKDGFESETKYLEDQEKKNKEEENKKKRLKEEELIRDSIARVRNEERRIMDEERRIMDEERRIIEKNKPEAKLIYCDSPNSVGGVSVGIIWENKANKIAKYVYFTLTPYNRVDDRCYSEISHKSTVIVRDIGPYEKGVYKTEWEDVWYNSTISYCILTKVSIEYMDGTRKDINLKIKSTDDIISFISYKFDY